MNGTSFGHAIRTRRLTLGLTQKQVADSVGVDQSTLCNWESGRFSPRPTTRLRLAIALQTTVEQLTAEPAGV